MIFAATKIGGTKKNFPSPLLVLLLDSGSGMDKNQDPGSGIKNLGTATLLLTYIFCPITTINLENPDPYK